MTTRQTTAYPKKLILSFVMLLVCSFPLRAQFRTDRPLPDTLRQFKNVVGAIGGSGGAGGLGGATYTIPIRVPEGLGGLQPSVAVTYNSQGGNGLLGWCWDLQGVSSIARVGTTHYHDGKTSGVDFDDDRFALDGQRLVCVRGTYGANEAEYRTEIDGMAKIVSYTCDTTSGPAYFKVWLPNGNVAFYGNTTDSRIGLQQRNDVCLWLLNRVEDRNGNYMEYVYIRGGDNYALKDIRYGGNNAAGISCSYTVSFSYSFKDDPEVSFIGDNAFSPKRKLDAIQVFHGDYQLYGYWFEYYSPDFSNGYYYTRLHQIHFDCGEEAYNPTVIQWGQNDYGSCGSSQNHTIDVSGGNPSDFSGKVKFTGDFNGDGFTDFILYYPNLNGHKKAVFFINKGVNNNGTLTFSQLSSNITLDNDIDWIYTPDINGDGLDDIVLSSRDRTFIGKDRLNITAYLSYVDYDGGYSFYQASQTFGEFRIKKKYHESLLTGDFLGEGKQSFLLQECEDSKAVPRLFYITCSNDTLSAQQLPQDMVLDADKMFACDFNGDGLSEIYFMNEDNVATGLLRMRHSGSGFSYETVNNNMLSPWHQIFLGDFNGDGKPDLLTYVEDGNGDGSWHLNYFKESRMKWPAFDMDEQVVGIGNPGTHGYSLKYLSDPDYKFITVGDFNGDGKADVAVRTENDQMKFLYGPVRNVNGQGQFASSQTVGLGTMGMVNVSNQTICTGNFLGQENLSVFSSSTLHALNPLSNRYSVTSVTDGMGNRTEFEYDYLMPKPSGTSDTDFYIRTPQTSVEQLCEMFTLSLPMKGMSKMTTSNIYCQSPVAEETYRYRDALVHKRGRGFLGFKATTAESWLASTKQQTMERYFATNTIVPSLALASENVRIGNGSIVAITQNNNAVLFRRDPVTGTIQKIFVPIVRKQTARNYDIDHPESLLKKTITEYVYNDSVVNLPDGWQVNVYDLLKQTDVRQGVDSSNSVTTASACEFQTLTHTEYYTETSSDLQAWIVNRPRSVLSTARRLGNYDDISNLVVYGYADGQYGGPFLPACVINYPSGVENQNDPLATFDSTVYSQTGLVMNKIVGDLASELPTKRNNYLYSPDGRFLTFESNTLGYSSTYVYDHCYGFLLSETDCNGLQTDYKVSPLGTWKISYPPNGDDYTDETIWVAIDDTLAPQNASYCLRRYYSDARGKRTYFDASGKKLRTVSPSMYTELVIKDFVYNDKGLLAAESLPYFYGADTVYWTHYQYDSHNRLYLTEHPDGLDEVVFYEGAKTAYLKFLDDPDDPLITSTTVNAAGWTVKSKDENGNEVWYDHYADGKLKTAQLGNDSNTVVSIEYDAAGNRFKLIDPNYGMVRNHYDAFGQLTATDNPSGETTEYRYDVLGRMVKRYEYNRATGFNDSTLWIYSETSGTKGLLQSILFNGTEQVVNYTYDRLNRVSTVTEQRGLSSYSTHYTYDYASRVNSVTYPLGFTIIKYYTKTGHLEALYNSSYHTLLWATESKNAFGQVTRYRTGNGVAAERDYDPLTGRLTNIVSWKGNDTIQNLSYVYDKNANLASRKDNLRNMEERFTYDRLDRLTGVIEGGDTTGVFVYDGYGRMTMKRLHGAMVFDNTAYGADGRPHALERARMYDELPEHSIRYTSFDKILSIQQDEVMLPDYGLLRFEYGYGHQRLRTTEFSSPQDSVVKVYVGSCEFVETNGVTTSECTFLSGPLGVFAVLDSHVQPLGKGMYYVHPDHLGSWTTVTNRNGLVVQDVRFDPWGTPYYSDSTRLVEATSLLFDRGFTGHEHLLRYGLINMNGRVYDPVTSTFLSVDNYVQDPSSTQNFNRYAYCMNNPLKYTDPDGELAHWIIGALIGGVVNLATNWSKCKGVWDYFAAFGAGAANGVLSATVPVFGSIIGGALTGATNNLISQTGKNFSGFENINMNSFWNSVGYGGIAGLAGYGGGYLGAKAGNVLINGFGIVSPVTKGVVGGVMGGAAGGFASGSIIGGLQTGDFGQAMQLGWDGLLSGASIGAVSGGIAGYNHAKKNDLNPWTGVKNGNKIVIGRDMSNRVNPIAKDLKSETISEAWENTTKDNFHNDFLAGKQFNKRWIEIKIEEQYAIYDIGPGNNDIGINYGMELRTINQYENVFQVKVVIQTKYIRIITY